MTKHITTFIFLSLLSCIYIYAQENNETEKLKRFIENINIFNYLYPQEKVYLHFDNTGYFVGETMWFKAYVVQAEQLNPTPMSRVLYVELLSPEGNVEAMQKLKIENGQCHGQFLLDSEKKFYSGFYEARAYTRCMLNFSEEIIFSRVFPIFNKPKKEGEYNKKVMSERPNYQRLPFQRKKPEKSKTLDVSFFPEGGSLINGLHSRIAFKATDQDGVGISVNGYLYEELNPKDTIATFTTFHDGMGLFNHIPDGKKYAIKVKYNEKEHQFPIPKELSDGYVLKVDNQRKDQLRIEIQKSDNTDTDTVGISVSCRGKIYAFNQLKVTDEPALLKIPTSEFPQGVYLVTLFNSKGKVYGERLSFIKQESSVLLNNRTDNLNIEPFEPITLNLQVTDQKGEGIKTNFSLSVQDNTSVTNIWQDNICTNLLLSSDLKGYINNPEYYFEKDDVQHNIALDLLMMTQGWRRYEWETMILPEQFEVKHPIEKGILINGQVISTYSKKVQKERKVTMWMTSESDGLFQNGTCDTNEKGWFNFLPDDFYGRWNINFLTTEKDKKKWSRVTLDRVFSPQGRNYTYADTRLLNKKDSEEIAIDSTPDESQQQDSLDLQSISKGTNLLSEVTITKEKRTAKEETAYIFSDIEYDVIAEEAKLEDTAESYTNNIADFLERTNPYFSAPADPNKWYTKSTYKNRPVLFYTVGLDTGGEVRLDEVESIMISERFPDAQVDGKLRVAVFLFMNKDIHRRTEPKGIRKTIIEGYSRPREFYKADYSKGILPEETDFRRTLYWNPNVETDDMGKANVSFYNNGTCKKMNISAEGLTKEGIPFIFEENK